MVNNTKEIELENARIEKVLHLVLHSSTPLINQPFHTDLVCDTVALLTVSCGLAGGGGVMASAWTVYNELAATRPDLIHVLAASNWPFDT